ncbi:MAG: hypothetical protein K0R21_2016 [Anaerocolumna sp.]|jgi:hypothetical protein|nr:hypothetical protein [Anaerocolumna sp.]
MDLPKEFELNGKKVVLEGPLYGVVGERIYAVIDFERNFDHPDLQRVPTSIMIANTLQDKYLIEKYNIVIGEVREQC